MYKIVKDDPYLQPFEAHINKRMENYDRMHRRLLGKGLTLNEFANGHDYYGFHQLHDGWVYREWAPAADGVYLTGDFNGWNKTACPLTRLNANGDWEVTLPGDLISIGSRVKTIVKNGERLTEHLPLYTRRAVQDPVTMQWCCEVYDDRDGYAWTDTGFYSDDPLLIYEAHVGMAQEEPRIGSYREFADLTLPRILKAGYNAIQLMAIMEHPFYGSFGYQVSNFFAACSRYGTPDDLKYLINKAHSLGIRVLLDVVHSHAVKNTQEGINLFDGTVYQFFHDGPRGEHSAWGTKCFNYGNGNVVHFLLSNLKFWMQEYHFDGFRFDGVTSMLYLHHGLGVNFDAPEKYFSDATDTDAITYLQLANELIRQVNPHAVTIAEDMSGMPGMTAPIADGGIGFDYRLAMGLPDMWIRYVKTMRDEDWYLGKIWQELTFRTAGTIAYLESHDQALVGDQTMMFRLAGADMYTDMVETTHTNTIDRAVALHKLMRLVTACAGGDGYLNFMGNEFGHPEWIDFPRPENNSSFQYCRRQWSLVDNPFLKYKLLNAFDHDMISLIRESGLLKQKYPDLKWIHEQDKILAFERAGLLFVFNFHPNRAYEGYPVPVTVGTDYQVIMSSDDLCYGGFGRVDHGLHSAMTPGLIGSHVRLYLPPRTAVVLKSVFPASPASPMPAAASETPATGSVTETYILNSSSKKFHRPGCRVASAIRPNCRLISTESREALIRKGYRPCRLCGS